MIPTATAIVAVHSHPIAHSGRGSTKRAHDLAAHRHQHDDDHQRHRDDAVDHRRPEQRLDRVDTGEVDADADQGGHRDRGIERLGVERLAIEPGGPAERLAERIGAGTGEHRHRQQSDADDADGEHGEGEHAGDRPQRLGRLRGCLDVGDAVRVQGRRGA